MNPSMHTHTFIHVCACLRMVFFSVCVWLIDSVRMISKPQTLPIWSKKMQSELHLYFLTYYVSRSNIQTRKDTEQEDLCLSGGHFIRVGWPVLNKKQAKMESSGSRMVPRRLLGCCVFLLAAVMLVGFTVTLSTHNAGISSNSPVHVCF